MMPARGLGTTDVLVIGGGLLGCATAYHLAQRGVDVLILERGELNRAASGANAGTLHIQMPGTYYRTHYDGAELTAEDGDRLRATARLYAEAAHAWRTLEDVLGSDLGVRLGGGLMVAETAEDLATLQRKSALERRVGIATEILGPHELLAIAPSLSGRLAGASYCAEEGFANPLRVTPAYLRAAARRGARAALHTRVLAIERAARGRFTVRTSGGVVDARRIVCVAGAQTDEIAAMVGLQLPVVPHPLQVMVTEPRPPVLTQLVQHASRRLSLRQTPHGTFVIGGAWPALTDGVDARLQPAVSSIVGNVRVAVDVVPGLAGVRLLRTWAGMTTTTGRRNRVGIVGEYERVPGFFVLVAGGWGFTLGPVLGALTGELICDGGSRLPVEEFGLARCAGRP